MKLAKYAAMMVLAVGLSSTAFAQPPVAGQAGDQVDQLDQLVDLTDTQKKNIRGMMHDTQSEITELNRQAQESQRKLVASIKPDFDEGDIRDNAEEFGELTGKITAETALLQARIQKELTAEQRATLQRKFEESQKQMHQRMQKAHPESQ